MTSKRKWPDQGPALLIRVTPEEHAALKVKAKAEERTLSSLVRYAIKRYVSRLPKRTPALF